MDKISTFPSSTTVYFLLRYHFPFIFISSTYFSVKFFSKIKVCIFLNFSTVLIKVFKVLALNCLVSAYMMSALYLRGLKQGDMQMTFSGLITASLFFFLSQVRTSVF